ncbi:hypothetical protein TRFO_34963 [Tritrichomonas foetus]|uniref:Uncharacterized protein n=1 Tax=Tritrichomonas foetus TaxID=1144522 RepID=A0A1J4JN01_9EUKA|nr:hypothetical protein TRFO_34963 [Tritrichomonas foetus]|eukprot:OHS98628.1 hypothetical protein TRFO_34963 [Tritrichomonas foetus]
MDFHPYCKTCNISDTFMANRRWLTGSKKAPFKIKEVSLYPNHFPNEIAMSDTCSIQKKDGKISFIDIAKEIVIPLNYHNVQCIQSIKDFKYHFFAVANQNHLYFIDEIGNSNLVCNSPLPFKQAFHGFSYREPSHRTNHFYVACATKSTVLTIFRYVKNSSTFLTIRNLVITKNEKQTISTVTSFDYQDANHSLSKYILVSTFNNAYLINFTLLLSKIDENFGMDRNEDMSGI